MVYQTSKQLAKFMISGIVAVTSDLLVYYALSAIPRYFEVTIVNGIGFNETDLYKGIGFIVGTFVTYNLNKYWTWRQSDKRQGQVSRFIILYAITFFFNVIVNKQALVMLPDNEFAITILRHTGISEQIFAMKIDKILAFGIATFLSSILSFSGQKFWVFKDDDASEIAEPEA
jgi:putative flippase GtrA